MFANLGSILTVMDSLINIIIRLETFYDEFAALINKTGMHVYIEKRAGKSVNLKKLKREKIFCCVLVNFTRPFILLR